MKLVHVGSAVLLVASVAVTSAARAEEAPLKAGDSLKIGAQTAVVKTLDTLPYVDTEYTRAFTFDQFDNPKHKEFRDKYKIDEVVAPGTTEFEKQILLMDWVNSKFPKFGRPSSTARGGLSVLQAVEEGHTFYCAHYTDVLVTAAASLGWIDRPLSLHRPHNIGDWATGHSGNEIWSNQHKKWIMLDPTYNVHVEKKGVPLSAYETRQEWYYNDGRDMDIFIGTSGRIYKTSDMPVFRRNFKGFGDINVNPTTFYFYGFIGYIPGVVANNEDDRVVKWVFTDKFSEGSDWLTRPAPQDPAHDLYFPMGQANLSLLPASDGLRVDLKTLTPNLDTYLLRVDAGEWKPVKDSFAWKLHAGENKLEAKTRNKFGIEGPVSTAVVDLGADAKAAR